jgi:putative transposase
MEERSGKLVAFPQDASRDVLSEVLREGARQMLARAIEAEVQGYLAAREGLVDDAGHRLVVRNGHLPARTIQTALGDVPVQQPRVRDRRPAGERETFQSSILPPYLRRTKSLEELLPWLYLKGVSTGDFSEALAALLGPEAPGLSATTITRLKAVWQEELAAWQQRVGFGPTGSTTKGFRFCLLHLPSSLPRLGLARGTYFGVCLTRDKSA